MKIKNTRRGFTLIELLVVVIIIGILAAIALPQYNKAVMKSRFAALKPIAKSVKDAQEIYFNREGHYAGESELGDLDIAIPEGTSLDISATGEHLYVRANNPTGLPHNSYTMYFNQSKNFAGNIYCEAYTGDTVAENLCIAEGGTAGPTNGSYTLYLLSGNSTGKISGAESGPTVTAQTQGNCTMLNAGPYGYSCVTYTLSDESKLDVLSNPGSNTLDICSAADSCERYYLNDPYGYGPGGNVHCGAASSCNDYFCDQYPALCSIYFPEE